MTRKEQLIHQLEAEAATTLKFIEVYPFDKNDHQIHPKSMQMGHLFAHILELADWGAMALTTEELDFEKTAYVQMIFHSKTEALEFFNKAVANAKQIIRDTEDRVFDEPWILRSGETILVKDSKENIVRVAHNQTVHHRAQLGVYFRMLGIPVPTSYGPTADVQF